jgi:hypothetical protein
MNKEQQELLDEVYRKYADSHKYFVDGWLHVIPMYHSKETFVNECKTDKEFSERWGLKIEEQELGLEERYQLMKNGDLDEWLTIHYKEPKTMEYMDKHNVPTKLNTITYNNKTIESYENTRIN